MSLSGEEEKAPMSLSGEEERAPCEHPLMTAHAGQKSSLSVMTLNLWGHNKWRSRRWAVVDWINEIKPDLVALQEVVVRRIGMRQASWIAKRTGMAATFCPTRPIRGGQFGNAVLSRLPVQGSRCQALTDASSGNEPRAIVTVDVDAFGRRVSFSSTHLSWQFDEGWVREEQVRDIAGVVGAQPPEALTIVCGDFNAEPDSAEVRFMTELPLVDAFAAANPGKPGYTWSDTNPFAAAAHESTRRIDYIFVGAGRVLTADVVCNEQRRSSWPTDHFGVAATVSL
jgi:endonuclease/exonuclease/phosphatase family metal-dependent hydrolase